MRVDYRSQRHGIAGVTFAADLSGALFWEEQRLLVVSDLHLEKGSSFATRGVLLPPYDTLATLSRLAAVISRHNPRTVIALGDSFHDRTAHERLSATIAMLSPHSRPAATGSGSRAITIRCCRAISAAPSPTKSRSARSPSVTSRPARVGEIAGHLHPKARVSARGRSMERRCFASDGMRAVMPAFGAYAGGLSIRDAAFAKIFPRTVLSRICSATAASTRLRRRAVIEIPASREPGSIGPVNGK